MGRCTHAEPDSEPHVGRYVHLGAYSEGALPTIRRKPTDTLRGLYTGDGANEARSGHTGSQDARQETNLVFHRHQAGDVGQTAIGLVEDGRFDVREFFDFRSRPIAHRGTDGDDDVAAFGRELFDVLLMVARLPGFEGFHLETDFRGGVRPTIVLYC